jgi:hypothetical protein
MKLVNGQIRSILLLFPILGRAGYPRIVLFALTAATCLAATSSSLNAQQVTYSTEARARADRPQLTRVRALGSQTLEYLRADDLSQAMRAIGDATDLASTIWTKDDTGLAAPAAGVHRKLMQLDADERFDLLHEWSMPTASRRTVRVLTSLVPHDAPPKAFARILGERPRDDSFPISEINGVDGIFSTAWLLVESAEEAGRLRRLIVKLSELADIGVPNAAYVLLLARIVNADQPDEELAESVRDWRAVLSREQAPQSTPKGRVPQKLIWQFGYTTGNANPRRIDFKPLPFFNGFRWQGSAEHPDPDLGWVTMQAHGGIVGARFSPVRRWVAPDDGTLSITGDCKHTGADGDGIRARIISSRFGEHGEWEAFKNSVSTPVESIEVKAWDTIDFVTDPNQNPGWDNFQWFVKLILLKPDGGIVKFDSVKVRPEPGIADVPADVVFAAACLEHKWLQSTGESCIEKLLENAAQPERRFVPAASVLTHTLLQRAHAAAVANRYSVADFRQTTAQPKHWVAGRSDALLHARGGSCPAWLAHDDHILHLSGAGSSALLFRYPLTGEFELSCEAQLTGTSADAGVEYGGLQFFADSSQRILSVFDDDGNQVGTRPCQFVRGENDATFNRLSIRSTADGAKMAVNGHPAWTDTREAARSPWVGLRAFGGRRPLFRNLRIVGTPVIPREVRMSGGDSLRGWVQESGGREYEGPRISRQGRLSGEGLIGLNPTSPAPAKDNWSCKDGIVHGTRVTGQASGVRQSHLSYQRPLLHGESISYEFHYEPDAIEVHPTLGRLAFLIEPGGVRLHWITADTNEWTGLTVDNEIVEPLHRRGPKPLPLQVGEWNRVQISLAKDFVTLSLNDKVIYERPFKRESERRFGLFHDRSRCAVRVRNVVMTGDWPEELPAEVTANLAAATNPSADHAYLYDVFGAEDLAKNVLAVRRRAESLPDAERFAFLADSVLPSRRRRSFRLAGAFTTTHPAPTDHDSRVDAGGQLVSPAYDLIDIAARLDRLDELRNRVEDARSLLKDSDEAQQRARFAMLFLIEAARGDQRAAETACAELQVLSEKRFIFRYESLWPETLAAVRGHENPETREIVSDLSARLLEPLSRGESRGSKAWDHQIVSRLRRESTVISSDAELESAMTNWIPASVETALTRGQGHPPVRWQRRASQVVKLAPHGTDLLYYRIPLTGDFDVECSTSSDAKHYAGLMFGGVYHAFQHGGACYEGTLRSSKSILFAPPISHEYKPIRMRLRVRDGVCTTFVNGRAISSRELPERYEPWLAIYSDAHHMSGVRDLCIAGDPVVPAEIELAADAQLLGWLSYFDEQVGTAESRAAWQHYEDPDGRGILGLREPRIAGSFKEGLVQYHRPIVDDGVIEYEFFYVPGQVLAHPAFDRLAFLLDPDGVKVHWVTDGAYASAGTDPTNQTVEPDHRRGPQLLPLREDEWNRMAVAIRGDTVALMLNGQSIYERPLEATNQRTFGLFHYADQTEVRVRNLVLQGDWPKAVPPEAEQEFASKGVKSLNVRRAELPAKFSHSFVDGGLPAKYFKTIQPDSGRFEVRPNGLFASVTARGNVTSVAIAPRVIIAGDFDLEVAFEQLEMSADEYASILLHTEHADDERPYYRVIRMVEARTYERVKNQLSVLRPGGGRSFDSPDYEPCESSAGRLRLARRGDTFYFLFADGDSTMYRVIGTQKGSVAETVSDGIQIMPIGHGASEVKVTLKDISIRAEKLTHNPPSDDGRPIETARE